MTKTATRRCANPKCGKPLKGRANRLYCGTRCSTAAAYARRQADPAADVKPDLCFGCSHPTMGQAEPVASKSVTLKRHPYGGSRPEFSGYCVDPECPCKNCRPENKGGEVTPKREEPKPETKKRDIVGKCPIPKLRNPRLANLHKRAVREGRDSCSCDGRG